MKLKNEESRIHADVLKMFRSPEYRKKVKRLITRIKAYRGLGSIVRRSALLKKNATDIERSAHATKYNYLPDLDMIRYFAGNERGAFERRTLKPKQFELDTE